jgi:hypothetical protein
MSETSEQTVVVAKPRGVGRLGGRYPAGIQRARTAGQLRLLRRLRSAEQWAGEVFEGKVPATVEQKIRLLELLLRYTQPKINIVEQTASLQSTTLTASVSASDAMAHLRSRLRDLGIAS